MHAKTGNTKHNESERSASTAVPTWRVRNEDGQIFGPADQRTLLKWSRDGRIGPDHTLSRDGREWLPAPSLEPLEMDWIAEIKPGSFYGPIHRQHLERMIADGSLNGQSSTYRRRPPDADDDPDAALQTLRERMAKQQQVFDSRMQEAESQRQSLQREVTSLQAALKARDFEFEAERQDFKAAQARYEAERLKRDAVVSSSKQELDTLRQAVKGRHAIEARLAELESQLADATTRHKEERIEWHDQLETQRKAIKQLQAEKETIESETEKRQRQHLQEVEALKTALQQHRQRESTVRTCLQQALAAANSDQDAASPSASKPSTAIVTGNNALPLTGEPDTIGNTSLAGIEAQAQRELRELHARGGNVQSFLKRHGTLRGKRR